MRSRPLARLAAATTLAIFLLAQPGSWCLPLCWTGTHYELAAAPPHQHPQVKPCHSDLIRIQSPAPESLGTMLPVQLLPSLPSGRIVAMETQSAESFYLPLLPSNDPPPPRPV